MREVKSKPIMKVALALKGGIKHATTTADRRLIISTASNSNNSAAKIEEISIVTVSLSTVKRVLTSASHLKCLNLQTKKQILTMLVRRHDQNSGANAVRKHHRLIRIPTPLHFLHKSVSGLRSALLIGSRDNNRYVDNSYSHLGRLNLTFFIGEDHCMQIVFPPHVFAPEFQS